jgi:hypothetical protein
MVTTKGTKLRENQGVVRIETKTSKVDHLVDPIL